MTVHVYPGSLRAILVYLDALDAADKAVSEIPGDYHPFPREISLTDEGSGDWGMLRDEIGGAWHWEPPVDPATLRSLGEK